MPPGAFTSQLDLIQLLLVAFAIYFGALVLYLRREDKREGYPLVARRRGAFPVIGWPAPPPTKVYRLMDGGTARMPHRVPQGPAEGLEPPRDGMPLAVSGDRLTSGLGASAFVLRSEVPMRTIAGDLLLQPLRRARDWGVRQGETDLRGLPVTGRDFRPAGTVADIWVDRGAKILRYLEVALDHGGRTVLVPIFHCSIEDRDRKVRVTSLKAAQLPLVPTLAAPDVMTPREEDRINAFHAGATLYADPYPLP